MDCLFVYLVPRRAANDILERMEKRESERKDVLRR